MKTIGERIRQAREAKKWSGATLAEKVGYKNQSSIGNLENRATGTGGNQIGKIADALEVRVDWLLRGPDSEQVPFISGNTLPGTTNSSAPSPQMRESEVAQFHNARRKISVRDVVNWLAFTSRDIDATTRQHLSISLASVITEPETADLRIAQLEALLQAAPSSDERLVNTAAR